MFMVFLILSFVFMICCMISYSEGEKLLQKLLIERNAQYVWTGCARGTVLKPKPTSGVNLPCLKHIIMNAY